MKRLKLLTSFLTTGIIVFPVLSAPLGFALEGPSPSVASKTNAENQASQYRVSYSQPATYEGSTEISTPFSYPELPIGTTFTLLQSGEEERYRQQGWLFEINALNGEVTFTTGEADSWISLPISVRFPDGSGQVVFFGARSKVAPNPWAKSYADYPQTSTPRLQSVRITPILSTVFPENPVFELADHTLHNAQEAGWEISIDRSTGVISALPLEWADSRLQFDVIVTASNNYQYGVISMLYAEGAAAPKPQPEPTPEPAPAPEPEPTPESPRDRSFGSSSS